MNDQEMDTLIEKMQQVFPSRNEMEARFEKIDSRFDAVEKDLSSLKSEISSTRQEMGSRLDIIEKDLKTVVRIYNLDEEMSAVYDRISRIEQKLEIKPEQ
jgi:predicted  nucleic acid-binding Zn-ribbon protein